MLPPGTDIFEFLLELKPADWPDAVRRMGFTESDAFDRDWPTWAHEGQQPPAKCPDGSDWSTWVIKGGRGFGKTLAGSHWIAAAVASGEKLSIALVGATLEETRRVMIERRGGLLDVAGAWIRAWNPNLRTLRFRTGAEATLFSGASPDQLRGAEHTSPGATSSPNGRSRARPGTCCNSACAAGSAPEPSSPPPRARARC